MKICPNCGQPMEFDYSHLPNAWRHVENESRWCTPTGDNIELVYSPLANEGPKVGVVWA